MNLDHYSKDIRKTIIHLANQSASPHTGSALSCVDILTVLYFDIMNLEPWEHRDIFILSKAHAAMSLYATLNIRGIIDQATLDGYYKNNGTLPAHLDRFTGRGIEVSAGSLGHGFNIGLGMAFGLKLKSSQRKVYTIIGDGESQEGSIWEGALFGSKFGIDNFTAILDYNNLQGYGRATELCSYEPIAEKWQSFGWYVISADGHNKKELKQSFNMDSGGKPKIIIAKTIKGKGVSFMEDQLIWHYYRVTNEHKKKAFEDLA
jgi:transketolase